VVVRRLTSLGVSLALVSALGLFYYAGASEHARRVNTARGRADQSGYLWDALAVHGNWRGNPPVLIGERNRMPVYPGMLALLYEAGLTPDEFFERGKRFNILLSMALLGILAALMRLYLPPLPSAALVAVIAFGYFIHRAGYVQPELLFYTLVFAAFLACVRLLTIEAGPRAFALASAGGLVAALAHLTKAAVLPLVALFIIVFVSSATATLLRGRGEGSSRRQFVRRLAIVALYTACFLGALYPYISNSKRTFGRYFYNVNTTFYVWYDDWPSASIGTYRHGDGLGWPRMPESEIPSMRKYLREHTPRQITERILDGFRDMVVVTYERFSIVKYVVFFAAATVAAALARRRHFVQLLRDRLPVVCFLAAYAVVYLLAIAFYKPISGTTGRMILAHVAPFLFACGWLLTRSPFAGVSWTIAGANIDTRHLHLFALAMVVFDVAFGLWPRLFAHFAGY
jgi:hypothetical protein